MIERTADRLLVSGDITIATVSALFSAALNLNPKNESSASVTVDFKGLEKVDSSAVSLMLVWLREAQRSNVQLLFTNVPENLSSLANLYGVEELLNLNVAKLN